MLMAEQEPYMLIVQPDSIMINPRELDRPFGSMVCFHPRYELGDNHNYIDKDDFLRQMYLNTTGGGEQGALRYERMVNMVWSRKMTGANPNDQAIENAMLNAISKKYIMLPLYLLDHSGLAMKTTSFSNSWDSGQVGWIYVSREDARKEFGDNEVTPLVQEKAEMLLRSEVVVYDSYLRGECYGYELYKNGEFQDSCWGLIGTQEEVCKHMADYLPEECKDMVQQLEEYNQPASIIKMLLRHAKMQATQAANDVGCTKRQKSYDFTR